MAKREARRVKLTDARVEALEPAEKEYTVWDMDPRRLGVRVLPSGAKVYVVRLQLDGFQRWVKIGRHGDGWDAPRARAKAQALLGVQASGDDPTAARDRRIPSLARAVVYYLREKRKHLKPDSLDRARTSLLHVVRRLGKRRVDRITTDEVIEFHSSMKQTDADGNMRNAIAANRATVALHGAMRFAIRKGWRTDNPAKGGPEGVKYFKEKQRERYLTGDETARLARVLVEAEGKESPFVLAAVKLILLTGCRQGEIFKLTWDEVDLEKKVLRLVDTKTGARTIYLNDTAVDVLSNMPRIEGNPYVIVGWKKGTHYKGEQKAWERIRAAAGITNLRLHDLRHNFASVLASGGASLHMIGALLGHKRAATTARYAHLVDASLRELTDKADKALGVVAAPPPRGNLLLMRRGRR